MEARKKPLVIITHALVLDASALACVIIDLDENGHPQQLCKSRYNKKIMGTSQCIFREFLQLPKYGYI
jgi:hypothetical protein